MSDQVDIGHGSKAKLGIVDDQGVVTEIAITPLYDFNMPSATFDEVDKTHFESPNRTKEFFLSLKDNGEVSLTFAYIPDSPLDVAMRDTHGKGCQLILTPNGGTREPYWASLKGLDRNIPLDDKMVTVATFRISGSVEEEPAV